jgi:hypothetical protein
VIFLDDRGQPIACSELVNFEYDDGSGRRLDARDVAQCEANHRREIKKIFMLGLGPPIGALMSGVAVAWAIRGFRH